MRTNDIERILLESFARADHQSLVEEEYESFNRIAIGMFPPISYKRGIRKRHGETTNPAKIADTRNNMVSDKRMVKGRTRSITKQDAKALILITSMTVVISALAMYFVLSSNLITGWDTPVYIYRVHVLSESGLERFLEVTGYGMNGILYYFLLYALHITTSQSLLSLEKIVPSILFGGLLVAPALVVFAWTRRPNMVLMSLLFTIAWPAPYILASNLHSNLLGFFLVLLAMALVPSGFFSSLKAYLLLIALMIMASLSHPLSALYFGLVISIGISPAIITAMRRKILFLKVLLLLVASSTLVIIRIVLGGELTEYNPLLNPSQAQGTGATIIGIAWGLELVGYTLLPLVVISISITLVRIVRSYKSSCDKKEFVSCLLVFVWAMSTIVFWFLSYLLPVQSSFIERLLILFPSPFLLTFLFAEIWGELNQ